MYLLVLFILLLGLLIYLIYAKPLNLLFVFDSDTMDMHISARWLSLFRMKLELVQMHISVYFVNFRIVSQKIQRKGKTDKSVLKALSLQNSRIRTCFGFSDPGMTGLSFGAVSFLGALFGIEEIEQFPEFIPEKEFLRFEVTSDLNLGRTIANRIRQKN